MKQFKVFNVQFEGLNQFKEYLNYNYTFRFDDREVEDLDNLDSAIAERLFELTEVYPESFNYQEPE